MKLTFILLILGTCLYAFLTTCRPNFSDHARLLAPAGLSSWLNYSIEFHPAQGVHKAKFVATLTNVSPYTLKLDLNDKEFHASFTVQPERGQAYQVFDKRYYGMLVTATWVEPVTILAPSGSVTWTAPLTSLVASPDTAVTEESLTGCTVNSTMIMAITPRIGTAGGYISNNATQLSNSIEIPQAKALESPSHHDED